MKISVFIPNYNYENYVGDAIESILNQNNCPPMKLIIIDDASTDNSQLVIQEIVDQHPHIKFVKNEKKYGYNTKQQNKGIQIASGDYIGVLASDDIYLPTFIERTLEAISKYPNAGVHCSSFSFFEGTNIDQVKPYTRSFFTHQD